MAHKWRTVDEDYWFGQYGIASTGAAQAPPVAQRNPRRARRNSSTESSSAPGIYLEYPSRYSWGNPTVLSYPAFCYRTVKIDKPNYAMGDRYGRQVPFIACEFGNAAKQALKQILEGEGYPSSAWLISVGGKKIELSDKDLERIAAYSKTQEMHYRSASEEAKAMADGNGLGRARRNSSMSPTLFVREAKKVIYARLHQYGRDAIDYDLDTLLYAIPPEQWSKVLHQLKNA